VTVALVTGGSSGIGRATVPLLRAAGHEVLATSLTGGGDTFAADLTTEAGCAAAVDAARRLGTIGVLICSAGTGAYIERPIGEQPVEIWDESVAIHLDAPFHLIRLAWPDLQAAGQGRIVIVSSTAALTGAPAMSAYSATKAGVLGLARSVAQDGGPFGITCNAVLPGWVRSRMSEEDAVRESRRTGRSVDEIWRERAASYPAGRTIDASEVANVIAFLCTPGASGISGEAIRVALGSRW
jgi:NAD(P)-dependent dehydrogenase (short-subunit alcohol dehydrogenase family)